MKIKEQRIAASAIHTVFINKEGNEPMLVGLGIS
jgi:hypothetical protein